MMRAYPGRMRPGLIEVLSVDDRGRPPTPGIRGACAPASLKCFMSLPSIWFHPVYPGRMRPGLIEVG